eukprot:gene1215-2693_t
MSSERYLDKCNLQWLLELIVSFRSIIFANYVARETARLGYTQDVEHSQTNYQDSHLRDNREQIFGNVAVLIYVFDVDSRTRDKDMEYFSQTLGAIHDLSPEAKACPHVLSTHPRHPMEAPTHRAINPAREADLTLNSPMPITCFPTSIWDETLYKALWRTSLFLISSVWGILCTPAWSAIVCSLIPHLDVLGRLLSSMATICDADE